MGNEPADRHVRRRIDAAGGKLDPCARGVNDEEYLPAARLGVTASTIKIVYYVSQASDPILNYIESAVKDTATNAALPPPTIQPKAVCAPTAAELAKEAGLSPAELNVLQNLGARRGELDQREQDLSTQVALNRAVALAEVRGAEAALSTVDSLNLDDYYLFHAVRADLLSRTGRNDEARIEYDAALARTSNEAERTFLARARAALPA